MTSIPVTAAHIRRARIQGFEHFASECPVALAIRSVLGPGVLVFVGTRSISFRIRTRRMTAVPTPPVAATWVQRFDEGRDVAPFTFDLDIPAPYLI